MIALVGKSGHGKTIMQRWVQSVYGNHAALMMYKEDTKNALVARLGLYGSLPLTVDEISNIDAMAEKSARKKQRKNQAKNSELRKEVDRILDKVNKEGMSALTDEEKKFLKNASRKLG